jgi:uncharacterized membrane protein (Fun14 family)
MWLSIGVGLAATAFFSKVSIVFVCLQVIQRSADGYFGVLTWGFSVAQLSCVVFSALLAFPITLHSYNRTNDLKRLRVGYGATLGYGLRFAVRIVTITVLDTVILVLASLVVNWNKQAGLVIQSGEAVAVLVGACISFVCSIVLCLSNLAAEMSCAHELGSKGMLWT